ncbi:hypothetical protein JTB14_029123 [Gonioctena quinquepunctata]|nr:hypothetical protein JTB14_029123 [Gonioctena quinquepunctata]
MLLAKLSGSRWRPLDPGGYESSSDCADSRPAYFAMAFNMHHGFTTVETGKLGSFGELASYQKAGLDWLYSITERTGVIDRKPRSNLFR